jgi:hypothetical protein
MTFTKDSGHAKHRKRGRHKRRTSPETQRWNEEHLIPERPPWMPHDVYVKLAALREQP